MASDGEQIADVELFQGVISFRNRWTVVVRNRTILAMCDVANPHPDQARAISHAGD
jgi:hypothetical protein